MEIIRDVLELGNNVSLYSKSDNPHIKEMYDSFRKKVVKVLRVIYLFRTEKDRDLYHQKLLLLKKQTDKDIQKSNREINRLIRHDLITINMASSLVNDADNLNDLIKLLIEVAEILYGDWKPLESEVKEHAVNPKAVA